MGYKFRMVFTFKYERTDWGMMRGLLKVDIKVPYMSLKCLPNDWIEWLQHDVEMRK